MELRFEPAMARVRLAGGELGLRFAAYGRTNHLQAAGDALPVPAPDRVEYRRGSVTEWYVSGGRGAAWSRASPSRSLLSVKVLW